MKKVAITLLIVIIIVVAILFLLFKFGSLGSNGGGLGNQKDNAIQVMAQQTTDEHSLNSQQDTKQVISITVYENTYLYNNNSLSLEELMDEILKLDKNEITIKVEDDDASLNAYQNLKNELDKNNIIYSEQ